MSEEKKKKVLLELSEEEAAQIEQMRDRIAKEKLEEQHKQDRQAYHVLVKEAVDDSYAELETLSRQLAEAKTRVYERFRELIDLKVKLYGIDSGQRSHTFRAEEGNTRITIGNYQRDGWLDTVDSGIAMVKEYVQSLAKDEESKKLVEMVMSLLERDQAGNLQADKVLKLQDYAEQSRDDRFIEGVRIIRESYAPVTTKLFIRAEKRNGIGKWINLPLGITEA